MSLGSSVTSLVRTTASTALRLPLSVVRSVAHAVAGGERQQAQEARATAWEPPQTDPVPRPEPAPLRDPVFTEPTASSRAEAHGGSGGRHTDDLYEEALADDDPTGFLAEPDVASDEGVLDPAVARAVRSEAKVMRRAASTHKEP